MIHRIAARGPALTHKRLAFLERKSNASESVRGAVEQTTARARSTTGAPGMPAS